MDESYKADKEYTSTLIFPSALDIALRDCCSTCGITLYSSDFPNKDFIIQEKPENITFRQFIACAAMIAGGNAVLDRYNRLKIIPYNLSEFHNNLPVIKEFKTGLNLEVNDVVITGVQTTGDVTVTDTDENGEPVEKTEEKTFQFGVEGYMLSLSNVLAKGNEEEFTALVGQQIVGFKFRPFSGDSVANPLLEFMDHIYIQDRKGRKYQTVITDVDFTYFGFTGLKCAADSPLRVNGKYDDAAVQAIIKAKELIEREKTERQKAIDRLNQMLENASGFYSTADKQSDGSVIMYIHDKPTISESMYVIKITGEAIGISNDGGKTYIYGLTYDGEAILRKIYAEGIDADYITTGHLLADRIQGGELTLGGLDDVYGTLKIVDPDGNVIGGWDKTGISAVKGIILSGEIETRGLAIRDGLIAMYTKGQAVGHMCIGIGFATDEGTVPGIQIRSIGGLTIGGKWFGVQQTDEYLGPDVGTVVELGQTGNMEVVTNVQIIDGNLSISRKKLYFHHGIMVTDIGGSDSSTVVGPQPIYPVNPIYDFQPRVEEKIIGNSGENILPIVHQGTLDQDRLDEIIKYSINPNNLRTTYTTQIGGFDTADIVNDIRTGKWYVDNSEIPDFPELFSIPIHGQVNYNSQMPGFSNVYFIYVYYDGRKEQWYATLPIAISNSIHFYQNNQILIHYISSDGVNIAFNAPNVASQPYQNTVWYRFLQIANKENSLVNFSECVPAPSINIQRSVDEIANYPAVMFYLDHDENENPGLAIKIGLAWRDKDNANVVHWVNRGTADTTYYTGLTKFLPLNEQTYPRYMNRTIQPCTKNRVYWFDNYDDAIKAYNAFVNGI